MAPRALGPRATRYARAEHRAQRLGQAPALGGLEPAAHADAGVGHHDVRRVLQAGPGGRAQLGVVGERHDAQRGGEHDPGAPALQQGGQLVAAPVRGDPDGVAGQRCGRLRQRRRGDDGASRLPVRSVIRRSALPDSRAVEVFRKAAAWPAGPPKGTPGDRRPQRRPAPMSRLRSPPYLRPAHAAALFAGPGTARPAPSGPSSTLTVALDDAPTARAGRGRAASSR